VSAPETAAPAAGAPAPAAVPPTGPTPGQYRVPSWGWRILGGALRLVPLVLLLIGLPVALLTFLQSNGISIPYPIAVVELAGIALTILIVARYMFKPTALFGPLAMAVAGVSLAYLYYLYEHSTYVLRIPNAPVAIGLTYSDLILLLMIVPALGLAAGAITTVEDVRRPRERLPFDYPMK
jgi:hypothetical protein